MEGSAYKTVTGDGAAALSVVGYGLVRAVDDCRQCLYISTPLSPTHLARVNVLYKLHGSITPEMWFFQQVGWVCRLHSYHQLHLVQELSLLFGQLLIPATPLFALATNCNVLSVVEANP